MQKTIRTYYFIALMVCFTVQQTIAQVVLEANGPGNTYELINSVLAPNATAVEAPDQCGNHASFGRHIAEVFDATLNQFVFEFYAHANDDNDRCMSFDRQRTEIKTYAPSPNNLKGTAGETVTYKWKFRLPQGFQASSSFTHIHQIKAVGGDEDDPIFTLTPRAGSTNRMELIHVPATVSTNIYLATANLSLFLGVWVEVTEQIKYGVNGTYSIIIKRVSDGATLLSYANNNILTMRANNDFVRPKWGIYRSLNNVAQLRDDSLRLASISIFEGEKPNAPSNVQATAVSPFQINLSWQDNSNNETAFIIERSLNGVNGWSTIFTSNSNVTSFSNTGLVANTTYYYRVKSENPAGESIYSAIVSATTQSVVPVTLIAFNAIQKANSTEINWEVINEVNLATYLLEGSTDGSRFSIISITKATQQEQYAYLHHPTKSGKYFYRLKMVDKNGSFQYSSILSVQHSILKKINVFPNPASNSVRIEFLNDRNSVKEVRLISSIGQLISKYVPNSATLDLSTSTIPNGKYFIEILYSNKQLERHSLLIQH